MVKFLSQVKYECMKNGFNYCRAVQLLASKMYQDGYNLDNVMIEIKRNANNLTNFSIDKL